MLEQSLDNRIHNGFQTEPKLQQNSGSRISFIYSTLNNFFLQIFNFFLKFISFTFSINFHTKWESAKDVRYVCTSEQTQNNVT